MSLANDLSSFAVTALRLGRGLVPRVTTERRPKPRQLLELYEFEACPFCRKVREVLCELDLDYLVHPVAHGSPRRDRLVELGGKMQVPYLVDPNTGARLYESADIIAYLNATYGAGSRAGWRVPVPDMLDDLGSMLAGAVRMGRGGRCQTQAMRPGIQPLTLYNMEGSPYCRKVREALSERDLPHVVKSVPKGSPARAELVRRGGKMQVPYLIDPNTGREMYESDDIVTYLETEYA